MNFVNNEALSFVSVGFFCIFFASEFINIPCEAGFLFVCLFFSIFIVFDSRTFLLQTLHVHEFLHTVRVLEPELHPDEGLSPLQAQLVPGFGPRQQVRDGTLSQTQDGLPEQTLAWRGSTVIVMWLQKQCEDSRDSSANRTYFLWYTYIYTHKYTCICICTNIFYIHYADENW